jgi:hypothetical protein
VSAWAAVLSEAAKQERARRGQCPGGVAREVDW